MTFDELNRWPRSRTIFLSNLQIDIARFFLVIFFPFNVTSTTALCEKNLHIVIGMRILDV